MNSAEWAAWVQGVGTVAAVFATIWLWWMERRRQDTRDEISQASQVGAWVKRDPNGVWQVNVLNSSHTLVYDMAVYVDVGYIHNDGSTTLDGNPDNLPIQPHEVIKLRALAPTYGTRSLHAYTNSIIQLKDFSIPETVILNRIRFRDASGVNWERQGNKKLTRLTRSIFRRPPTDWEKLLMPNYKQVRSD